MCTYIQLSDNRKKIISQFAISDRDKHTYRTVEDAVKDALRRAFKDINFRTLHQQGNLYPKNLDSGQTITDVLINKLEDEGFIQEFITYFKNHNYPNEDSFDKWHNKACENFLTVLKGYYTDSQYGKSQKIVNMMFKHLYCMNFGHNEAGDGSDWLVLDEEYFKHCHLTLDSFTLEWFHREVVDNWHDALGNIYGKQITKGKTDSWSNLCFKNVGATRKKRMEEYKSNSDMRCGGDKGEFYHYMFFVDTIREFFPSSNPQPQHMDESKFTDEQKEHKDRTPFQAEFYIWPNIQLHLTAEALFGQSIGQEEAIKELESITNQQFKDFASAQKHYRTLNRKQKLEILKKKIEYIEKIL